MTAPAPINPSAHVHEPVAHPASPVAHSPLDRVLMAADAALRAVWGDHVASRACPRPPEGTAEAELSEADKRHAAALMRVNHVGEVCAQALYASQSLGTTDPALKAHFDAAAREETDHLAWTEQRLRELGGRTSVLNPLWFAGSFAIGLLAARAGDKTSLGFVVETERQVEHHLDSHLSRLPAGDERSRAIVRQMRDDEIAHAAAAQQAGGAELPAPVRGLMKLTARVMTRTAYHL